MDAQWKEFKKRQYIANASTFVGMMLAVFTVGVTQFIGIALFFMGVLYILYQRLFQKSLFEQDMAFKKKVVEEVRAERAQESSTARDVRRIKFILTCMSASFAFFLLAIWYTLFANK